MPLPKSANEPPASSTSSFSASALIDIDSAPSSDIGSVDSISGEAELAIIVEDATGRPDPNRCGSGPPALNSTTTSNVKRATYDVPLTANEPSAWPVIVIHRGTALGSRIS